MLDVPKSVAIIDKLVWLSFVAALFCIPGSALIGWFANEVSGYIAGGLLPASLLVALAVGISALGTERIHRIAKHVWIGTMVLVMAAPAYVAIAAEHPDTFKDVETVSTFVFIVLTFPSGLVGPWVFVAIDWAFAQSGSRLLADFVLWLIFTALGYWQWFVAVPAGARAWQRRRRTTT